MEYRPYQDYDLPLLYFGDFHSARKEEQNKFLLDVSVFFSIHVHVGAPSGSCILLHILLCISSNRTPGFYFRINTEERHWKLRLGLGLGLRLGLGQR